ncbi:MAG: hypothetical protein IJX39_02515 [Clostridia bacterium]|nr:hypothetical protein [Clostridia bacterium]
MKKQVIAITAIAAVLLLVIGVGIFLSVCKGEIYVNDGLHQNSRVYMKDICYEEGTLYYTVVNDTFRKVSSNDVPYMERKENGVWKLHHLWQADSDRGEPDFGAFSQKQMNFKIAEGLTAADIMGEYRLIFGNVSIDGINQQTGEGEPYYSFSDDATYIVGYFTITEDMLD